MENSNNDYFAPPKADLLNESKKKYYTFPSRGKRLGSFLIDNLIAIAIGNFLFMFLPIKKIMGELLTNNNFNPNLFIAMTFLGFLLFAIIHGYFLQTTGQTIGKKILNLQIVSLDNKQLSLAKLLSLRYFILQTAIPIAIYYCLSSNIIFMFCLMGLVAVIDPIFIFGENRRCLHDLIAGTKVVNY